MPEINRGVAVAYCDPPGPLETAPLATFIAVSPTPATGPRSGSRSFYREYNRHMVHNLMVHEAMPGHYLQLRTRAGYRGSDQSARALRSGSFIEGWAVYTEEIMAEHGYRRGRPAGGPHAAAEDAAAHHDQRHPRRAACTPTA